MNNTIEPYVNQNNYFIVKAMMSRLSGIVNKLSK